LHYLTSYFNATALNYYKLNYYIILYVFIKDHLFRRLKTSSPWHNFPIRER